MRLSLHVAAVTAVLATLASGPGASAASTAAADRITNRETVQAELNPDGTLEVARLFSQLVVDGDGTVHVVDPTATKNLRNLDGFSAPKTENGAAVWDVDVHGRAERRTVADFTRDLPVTVSVTYTLDGTAIKPRDIVGKSGTLAATYHLKNVTEEPTEVTYVDGHGKTQTATVDVPTPYVGQLQTTLPSRFSAIDAPRADIAGDGRGGNLLTWTMVLFAPIGEVEQEFGWSARIENGIAPKAEVQIVPVPPKRKPELKFGEDGFSTGAAAASELTEGAGEIDENVVKLRDGASSLLSGLSQLAAGATELKAGLADEAAPGAAQIAGGLDEAAAGGGDLASGLGDLSDGTDLVAAGASDLHDGLVDIDAGLALLSSEISGLASDPGVLALKAGLAAMTAGVGTTSTAGTLLYGLNLVSAGLTQLATSGTVGLPAAKGGVDAVNAGLATAKTSLQGLQAAVGGSIAEIEGVLATLGCPGSLNPVCPLLDSALNSSHGLSTVTLPGLAALEAGTDDAITGLTAVSAGLATAIAGIGNASTPNTLIYGVTQVMLGLDHPAGAAGPSDPGGIKQGLAAVSAGIDQLVAGVIDAVTAGVGSPSDAETASLRGGMAAAIAGAADLADGADQVAAGAGDAADGASDLLVGLDQLKAGAHDLSSGLTDAAEGSGQIADGSAEAKDGSDQIAGGLSRLHDEGTSVITKKGNDTAADAALKYARLAKLDEKAASGGLPYGAPAGGEGSAAYLLTVNAADAQGTEDAGRLALAIGLLAVASAAGALVRRRMSAT